jgi:cytidylate kinase
MTETNPHPFHIAIDGPVAAGKGTIAKLLANRLGFLYVDTGAMYRVAAFLAKNHQVSWDDEVRVAELVDAADILMRPPSESETDGRMTTVIVDGADVSWAIRTEIIGQGASAVAKLPKVRQVLVAKQQQIAATQSVIMEGRDITFRVLPDAQLKIFLTASEPARAKRRHQELLTRGENISFEQVLSDLIARDKQDSERTTDPLQIVSDAWVIDTTDLSIEAVVDLIETKVKEMSHG